MDKRTVTIILSAVTVALAIVSIVVLPDNAVMQIGPGGQPSTYGPKYLAVFLPSLLSVIGIYLYHSGPDGAKYSYLILSLAGFAASAFFIVLNL